MSTKSTFPRSTMLCLVWILKSSIDPANGVMCVTNGVDAVAAAAVDDGDDGAVVAAVAAAGADVSSGWRFSPS